MRAALDAARGGDGAAGGRHRPGGRIRRISRRSPRRCAAVPLRPGLTRAAADAALADAVPDAGAARLPAAESRARRRGGRAARGGSGSIEIVAALPVIGGLGRAGGGALSRAGAGRCPARSSDYVRPSTGPPSAPCSPPARFVSLRACRPLAARRQPGGIYRGGGGISARARRNRRLTCTCLRKNAPWPPAPAAPPGNGRSTTRSPSAAISARRISSRCRRRTSWPTPNRWAKPALPGWSAWPRCRWRTARSAFPPSPIRAAPISPPPRGCSQQDWMLDLERRAIAAFQALGVLMTDTCINYQTIMPAVRGEHMAYGDTGVVDLLQQRARRAVQFRRRTVRAGGRPDRAHAALRLSSGRASPCQPAHRGA